MLNGADTIAVALVTLPLHLGVVWVILTPTILATRNPPLLCFPLPFDPVGRLGRKNGERGVVRPGENTDDDIDALITVQLAVDASRSSSSVAEPSSSWAPAVLSDTALSVCLSVSLYGLLLLLLQWSGNLFGPCRCSTFIIDG
jgi:hypothetical protein